MTAAEHLERIACDLNRSLMTPVGAFASKAILLMARLTHLVKRVEEKIKSGADLEVEQSILEAVMVDTVQLQRIIDDARSAMPLSAREDLKALDDLSEEANKIRETIEYLQGSIEVVQDNAALVEKNKVLKQKISALKNKILDKA
ncbi:hypothetical protein [Mycoavidus sp. B2-EB]|uniref:hypothetical protein n=1 Tax=Mycoavidus sp. B2-EB TaxID=2651972 RepID=UPI0016299BAF|nr:hypothetical protein [Mycoavidus sp. B2-EB]BBO59911.1 hypothetical protein MPB2EB_1041 [Mycoavidus sp. B2-EB]